MEGAEWVRQPSDIAVTPVAATSFARSSVIPPEASVFEIPLQSFTHLRMSAQPMLSSMIHSGFALRALTHSRMDSTSISTSSFGNALRAARTALSSSS